jgi:hypothetical protein
MASTKLALMPLQPFAPKVCSLLDDSLALFLVPIEVAPAHLKRLLRNGGASDGEKPISRTLNDDEVWACSVS